MHTTTRGIMAGALVLAASAAAAQQPQSKPELASVQEAMAASGQLAGSAGPRSVNWIDNAPSYLTMLKVYANTWCEHLAASCRPVNLNLGQEPKF